MIVSHEHKYLFVEHPFTASTAISRELRENYAGQSILHKHAAYREFLTIAGAEEQTHFVFAGIRNPLDVVVTAYFKRKTNHQGFYTDPKYWQRYGGHVSDAALREFNFIESNSADFPAFFERFYRLPYDSWSSPSPREFDFVIRYENLQDDFAKVLELLGIGQFRPLPVVNPTGEKGDNYLSYYTPEIRDRATRIFGPYMKKWQYDFPPDWGDCSVPWSSQLQFEILRVLRYHLVWGTSFYARLFRRFRRMWRGYL